MLAVLCYWSKVNCQVVCSPKMVLLHTRFWHAQLLHEQTADSVGPKIWPTNSHDLNSVDYGILGLSQECVYSESI